MQIPMPEVVHKYQNHHLDNARWAHYKPREGDVIVATSGKSGTTWVQGIVWNLFFIDRMVPTHQETWLELRTIPIADMIASIEAQTDRRLIKTHLPLDGVPFFREVKYIVVGRDPRDVFMSLWNHYSNYSDVTYERLNEIPGRVGNELPKCPPDIRDFWSEWISRGWFSWESEGYPFWSHLHHTQTWWDHRYLPNILFVHYNDLQLNLVGEIARIANYLEIKVSEQDLARIVDAVSLDSMRHSAKETSPQLGRIWNGGADTFFYKGTNGRWRDVLSGDDLALYENTATKVLGPACRRWLEHDSTIEKNY